MRITNENILAAPCGLYCGECVAYKAKDDAALREMLIARGIDGEKLPCPGCRLSGGSCPAIGCTCETYACIEKRGLDFCYECPVFPCGKLNPAADRADVLPHNMKVFNLCCIKEHGLAKWLEQEADIYQKYFHGKMILGKGPRVE